MMKDLPAETLATVVAWVEANESKNDLAAAFWVLMDAKEPIEKAIKAAPPSIGELYELEDAWYDARERLARLCLAEMKAPNRIELNRL